MAFREAIRIALQSLWANKLRSILTLIGVVIGVASVIMVLTLVAGVNKFVATKIYGYGADVFTASKQPAVVFSDAEYMKMNPEQRKALSGEYGVFTQSIVQSGHFKAGDGLQPVSTATTVRVRDGKTLTTDGPFAETREQLAGYYLIEARDLDDALAIAARIPEAVRGCIEVRPVMIYDN